MSNANNSRRQLLGLGLCALAPLLLGFLCFPLVTPSPSGDPRTPAATFAPTVSASVSNTAPGAQSDIVLTLDIPAGSTLAIAAPFTVPAGWTVASDAGPSGITNGARVGRVTGLMTSDQPPLTTTCNSQTDPDFFLLDATTSTSPTVPGYDADNDGQPEIVEDNFDSSGNPLANQLPDGVDRWPAFLSSPPLPPLPLGTIKARYFGHTLAGGIGDLYVNVLVIEQLDGSHLLLPIVQDPTTPPLAPINRMCAPQSFTLTLFGKSQAHTKTDGVTVIVLGGQAVYSNPSVAGSYTFSATLVSEFDADNDGVSNGLDNCPTTANATQADSDGDDIGNACEQDSQANFDYDNDGLENGFDNCIFVANSATAGLNNQVDTDFDDIGDVCDPNPLLPNGPNHYRYCTDPVGIGQADPGGPSCVASSPPPPQPDKDADTLPDKVETNTGVFVSLLDTGTNPNDPDTDDDGCADGEELGPSQNLGGRRNPVWFWDFFDVPTGTTPPRDKAIAITDIVAVVSRFGSFGSTAIDPLSTPAPPPAYHTAYDRTPASGLGEDLWDLNPPDGAISVVDIVLNVSQFGHSCVAPP